MTHRNRALLDLCYEAPCLLQLGAPGCGEYPSVPVHSDMIRHGRGEFHKSHDCFAVPGCPACHAIFTRASLGKEGYHAAWTEAMERYILYLWVSEKIQITAAPKAGKEPSMEATHCKICNHRHWAREPHILPADAPAEKRSMRNTQREGRDVMKPKGTSTERDHRDVPLPIATPGKPAGKKGQSRAAKPTPGKRKPRAKQQKGAKK